MFHTFYKREASKIQGGPSALVSEEPQAHVSVSENIFLILQGQAEGRMESDGMHWIPALEFLLRGEKVQIINTAEM